MVLIIFFTVILCHALIIIVIAKINSVHVFFIKSIMIINSIFTLSKFHKEY